MKCKDCKFWKGIIESSDYGRCLNPDNLDTGDSFDGDNRYLPETYVHKNDCCTSFVAAKITKE